MNYKIGILGCGWLGLPLAVSLIEKGHRIHGSSTSEDKLEILKSKGILPFLIKLGTDRIEGDITGFLDELDIVVINVPPGMRKAPGRKYFEEMKFLYSCILKAGNPNVLFVSSTSVYGNLSGEIDEDVLPLPVTESGQQLLESEALFMESETLQSSIVRFGGLIGPDRHPINMLAGRSGLRNGDDPVNLIHLKDCIHMLSSIIENSWWGQIFNGVYPEHPKKKDYYREEALKRNLQPPVYETDSGRPEGKCIISKNFLIKEGQFYTSIHS